MAAERAGLAAGVRLGGVRVGEQARTAWAEMTVGARLRVLRQGRFELARVSAELVAAISPELSRTRADSYAAEVIPLLAACGFLERAAVGILKARRLGRRGLPFWLAGVDTTVERVPMGVVLVIAPANYPLFLAGVQTLQALAAGNAVVWKPGRGGGAVAQVFREAMVRAGVPADVLRVTDETVEAGIAEMERGPAKVFFTGSGAGGRAVLRMAAERAIPVVAELSGCDAVVALESVDAARVVEALVFGMRLNGSATCMAPRRLWLVGGGHAGLVERLQDRFEAMEEVEVAAATRVRLGELIEGAEREGARVIGSAGAVAMRPVLVLGGRASMGIAQEDVFAPVLTVLEAADVDEVVREEWGSGLGLTAAIFGEERAARELGKRLAVGTVMVNDLIVPTADPRVPFGGRRGSGFGVTRGAEGLLEMTAVKVTAVRRGAGVRQYQETTAVHEEMFRGVVAMSHGATLAERFRGLRKMVAAARKLK